MATKNPNVRKKSKNVGTYPSKVLQYATKDPRFSAFAKDDHRDNAVGDTDHIDERFTSHLQQLHETLHGKQADTAIDSENISAETAQHDIETIDSSSVHVYTEAVKTISLTYRLALVDFELWECIVAQDLFVLFSSFLPHGGRLQRVAIYPTDVGKQYQQGRRTPDLWSNANHTDLNTEKVQQYKKCQRQFYYAILEFDSKQTASEVFDECQGIETEFSTRPLVLQAVPDDMEFSSSAMHDNCESFPANYTLPPILRMIASRIDSKRSSLKKNRDGNCTPKHGSYEKYTEGQIIDLSETESVDDHDIEICGLDDIWDITDPKRTAALDAAFSATSDMAMNDLDAYVASDVDSTESANQDRPSRHKYASLLDGLSENEANSGSADGNISQNIESASDSECGVMGDMDAEFVVSNEKGREDLHRKVVQELELQNASSIAEKTKLRRKMRKKMRKQAEKRNFEDEDISKVENAESEVEGADLSEYGSHAPKISLAKEKRKAHKLRKQKAAEDARKIRQRRRIEESTGLKYATHSPQSQEIEAGEESYVEDDRFSNRLTSHREYFLDPTLRKK